MARLYANENYPLPVVEELRRLGHDVLTIQEADKADRSMPDEEVLAFHPGIIVCSFDPDFVALAQRVHGVIAAQPNLSDQLVRINRPGPS
jgi:hypothetical protein